MATFTPSTESHSGKVQWRIRFVSLPHAMLTHPTYSELQGGATKLLLALLNDYVGNNNGHLTATLSRMKRFGFNSKDSLARGLRELIAFGYIVRTKTHHLRSPALYAFTWLPINKAPAGQPYDAGVAPSNEALDLWRHVDPCKARSAA
jgi:hypothetical protein